jgi:hypothetical protein
MNPRALRVLYEVLAAAGLNPALAAADVPDSQLVELTEGARKGTEVLPSRCIHHRN